MRCKIAHNNSFGKDDYLQIEALVIDVKSKLEKAIESLDKISVPEEDRDELAEVVLINSNALFGAFVQKWKLLESLIVKVLEKNGLITYEALSKVEKLGILKLQTLFVENNLIARTVYDNIRNLNKVRNILVHESFQIFSDTEVMAFSRELDQLIEVIYSLINHDDEN